MLLAEALAWHAAGRGRGMTCWPRLWHGMLLAKAVAWHACKGQGMACCWPRLWHAMLLAKAVAWHAGQGRRTTATTAGRHSTHSVLGYVVSMPQAKRWHVQSARLGIGVACGMALLASLKGGAPPL